MMSSISRVAISWMWSRRTRTRAGVNAGAGQLAQPGVGRRVHEEHLLDHHLGDRADLRRAQRLEVLRRGRAVGREAVQDGDDVLVARDDPGVQVRVPVDRVLRRAGGGRAGRGRPAPPGRAGGRGSAAARPPCRSPLAVRGVRLFEALTHLGHTWRYSILSSSLFPSPGVGLVDLVRISRSHPRFYAGNEGEAQDFVLDQHAQYRERVRVRVFNSVLRAHEDREMRPHPRPLPVLRERE